MHNESFDIWIFVIGKMGADLWRDKQKVNNKNIIKLTSFAIYEEIVYFGLAFALGLAYKNVC